MRSDDELLEASGYGSRPSDFDDLIRILDSELRLITPTDPEGSESEGQTKTQVGEKFFQLTHDYLVHSLRDWLTRKQRETRRGRAELRLAERSALWNAKPENRHLPSVLEWANIRLLTKKKDWTEPQRKMMKRAGRVHGLRGVWRWLLLIGVLARADVRRQVIENQRATQAAGLVQRLLERRARQKFLTSSGNSRATAAGSIPRLRASWHRVADDSVGRSSMPASPSSPSMPPRLITSSNRLLDATPTELPVLRDALKPHRSTLTPKLWTVLESAKPGDASLLPAASALADYDPDNAKWEAVGGKVAQALVSVNSVFLGPWIEALRPVRGKLTAPLATIFQDKNRPETEHTLATNILTDYASDDPDRLAELLMVVRPEGVSEPLPGRREAGGRTGLACLPGRACQESHVLLERSAARSIVDEARRRPREPDRVGTGDTRRAVRLLPDNAAGRVPHDRRGSPQIGISPRAVPSLRRWASGCGWRRSGPVMDGTGESLPV